MHSVFLHFSTCCFIFRDILLSQHGVNNSFNIPKCICCEFIILRGQVGGAKTSEKRKPCLFSIIFLFDFLLSREPEDGRKA